METELSTDLQTARIDFLGKGEAFQMKASCGSFQLSPRTQERIWLKDEELRGLKAVESLDSPLELIWHEPQSGDSLHLDFELVPDSLQKRRRPEPVQSEGLLGRLSKAMLDFLIFQPADDRPGLIAGYPWFNEWGRDTMIALPGLSVALGHDDMAMEILMAWASRCRGGLLPNRLAEDSGEVAYNSVDAPLWYWRSLIRLTRKAGAFSAMPEVLQKTATEILSAFHEGTDHGIHVDPRDGLLVSGTFNSHLTWMDAFVAGKAISPRHGKCVELQALYLEALVAAQELGLAPDLNKHWRERAKRLAQSFRGRFLGAAHGSLEDCVDGDESRLRPNQLVALGSAVVPLSSHERSTCFQSLSKELWTPRGPRSLAPTDPLYESHYGGGAPKRDRAYHQGTVWAWLTGPYVDASMQAEAGSLAELRRRNEERVASVLKDLDCGLRGQISEIFAASAPHEACGAPAQAWSVAEIIRVIADYNLDPQRISELMQVPD